MRWILATAALMTFSVSVYAQDQSVGTGKVVGEDYYFNHQEKAGKQFRYIWDDTTNTGYSKFGDVLKADGATLATLPTSPTRADLDKFSVYIIVNPTLAKNAAGGKPNYMTDAAADIIAGWVKDGGMLALFANDNQNSELEHYSILASRFGITFNNDRRNEVPNARDRSPGAFKDLPDHPVFAGVKMVYMKEVCTLNVKEPAVPLLLLDKEKNQPGKDIIAATAKYGKGTVFVVGDPWIYNEYIDVTSTPGMTFDNRKAAQNLAKWLLSNSAPPAAAK
jgi:unsaturated rhamnogalacturonyl hydrolase